MSSPSSYYLLGPIKVGEEFILTFGHQNIAYFLTLVKGENGATDDFIFDPRATGNSSTIIDPLVMKVISTGSNKYGITYTDFSGTLQYIRGLKINNEVFAESTTKSTGLIFHQTTAAPWPGIPFLTGIGYSINTISNQPILFGSYTATNVGSVTNGVATTILMKGNVPVTDCLSSGFRPVPTKWLERGSCGQTIGLKSVINNEILWAAGNNTQFKDGFTDITDCQAGVKYTYCPPGKDCSLSCKGPCPTSSEKDVGCFFDSSIKGFKCEIKPVDVPWYQQPWFIIGGSLFGLLFIIIIIFLFFRFSSHD